MWQLQFIIPTRVKIIEHSAELPSYQWRRWGLDIISEFKNMTVLATSVCLPCTIRRECFSELMSGRSCEQLEAFMNSHLSLNELVADSHALENELAANNFSSRVPSCKYFLRMVDY